MVDETAGFSRTADTIKSQPGERKATSPYLIAVASTFTVNLIEEPFSFWTNRLGIPGRVEFADFGQVFQELTNSEGLLSTNRHGFNVLLIRPDDWIIDRLNYHIEDNVRHLRTIRREIVLLINQFRNTTPSPLFVLLCPSMSDLRPQYGRVLDECRDELAAELRVLSNVHCWTHDDVISLYPVDSYEDLRADRIGRIPYTREYFVAVATLMVRRMYALIRPPMKVIAVDCDNTLWRGVCGEVGPFGIELTPAHMEFQRALVSQRDAGMLLCLCTKNNVVDVNAVFDNRTEMPLRAEHFVASMVNWDRKSSNLKAMAEELDLGIDSFIFIDDSPIECAEVRAHCPAILTLEFPSEEHDIRRFTKHTWCLDRVGVTEQSRQRTEQYKQSGMRNRALREAASFEEFLGSLNLSVNVSQVQGSDIPRVAELVQRTNQFNLSNIRRDIGEIEALWRSQSLHMVVVSVRDRFGDYGLVGAVFLKETEHSLDVDTFVLSCRVLGRGVEQRIVRYLADSARKSGKTSLILRYERTLRNSSALRFLQHHFSNFRHADQSGKRIDFLIPVECALSISVMPPSVDPNESEHKKNDVIVRGASYAHDPEVSREFWRVPDILAELGRSIRRRPQTQHAHVEPETDIERSIAQVWMKVIGLDRVSAMADFLEIGADSLMAVQVVSRIESTLGVALSLSDFLQRPTIKEVAAKVAVASRSDTPPIEPYFGDTAPLSPAQQRLWFIDQLDGGRTIYHVPVAVRMSGRLDLKALSDALDHLVARHEILRTVFLATNGELVQKVEKGRRFCLRYVDLRKLAAGMREAQIERESQEEFTSPFALSCGPLVRGRLLQLSDAEHVLLITMHHIVSDDWSVAVLLRELGILYETFVEGAASNLPPLTVQYTGYTQWQHKLLSRPEQQTHLAYWVEHLRAAPPLLSLPTDRVRPAAQSYGGANVRLVLGLELTNALKAFASQKNVTLAMMLYAAWSMFLGRIAGSRDIIVGLPAANRRRAELEDLIGPFVNTLAVRIRLDDDPLVEEVLQRAKEALLGAYAHLDVPFEHVVEAIRPVRSLSHSPIFQVMFVFHNAPSSQASFSNITVVQTEVLPQVAHFDVSLFLHDSEEGLRGAINYATDLFDRQTIECWALCFHAMLDEIIRRPKVRLSQLEMMAAEERRRVVEAFNETRSDYPRDWLIHQGFEQQVTITPEAVAVIHENESLTYSELNSRANQLAHFLRRGGVRQEQLVALCIDRCIDMLVGLLGVLKAGAAYVPLDPTNPRHRLEHLLRDARPNVLLTVERLKGCLPASSARLIALDGDWVEISLESIENIDHGALGSNANQLAYVIYTSGSTGAPKGVMVEHRSLVNYACHIRRAFDLVSGRGSLVCTSISFDLMLTGLYPTLLAGRPVRLCREREGVPALADELKECIEVTPLKLTPSHLPLLEDALRSGKLDGCVRVLVLGGESLHAKAVDDWKRYAPSTRIFNHYGPTETTIGAVAGELGSGMIGGVPIGKPISNTQIYILDTGLNPVPIGASGEIYIAGAGVTRGYLDRPELTAQRFIANPFSSNGETRMYKTGDLGRWRWDGSIECLGRTDEQVKIRGFRVELGEIEVALKAHEAVREAVVIAGVDGSGAKRLAAYLTRRDEREATPHQLSEFLRARLPEYMVPANYAYLEQMPLTSNGKLDRRALPAPDWRRYLGGVEPLSGTTEIAIGEIWCKLLGLERIGPSDSFFDAGGYSILVVKAISELNRALGCSLTVSDMYRCPTIREIAARIDHGAVTDLYVDLEVEASLDETIRSREDDPNSSEGSILLTGATGFVGRFLLSELLIETDANIYCLVRTSGTEAIGRLKAILKKWDLWRDVFAPRITTIDGDLELPRLGMSASDYEMLSDRVSTIFHCGTSMNHLETYAMAKRSSVDAARELLEFATSGRPKQINYISTLSVFSQHTSAFPRTVHEATSLDGERHPFSSGYAASKWVAEKLFITANGRGIPCNVFRLGLVWADSESGRYDELQREYRLLKSCFLSGLGIEDFRYRVAPTPVDRVARAIVFLAARYSAGHGTFHIACEEPMIHGVFEYCNEVSGRRLKLLPHYQWVQEIRKLHEGGMTLPIVPLIQHAFSMDEATFYEDQRFGGPPRVLVSCERTRTELRSAGMDLSPLNREVLRVSVESMLFRDPDLRRFSASFQGESDLVDPLSRRA